MILTGFPLRAPHVSYFGFSSPSFFFGVAIHARFHDYYGSRFIQVARVR